MLLTYTAAAEDAGRKIKYIVRGNMHVSYSQYCAMKTCNGLRVNGTCVHADYPVCAGDTITVMLPETGSGKTVQPEEGEVHFVYRDDDIAIIDKPAPLPCQCTPRQPAGTLENRLAWFYREHDAFVFRPVNRLDKGTSGLMCAAMHAHAYQMLQKQLHTESFVREYTAVAEGVLTGEGVIDLPIRKENAATVRRVTDSQDGLRAVTRYRAVRTDGKRTIVQLQLETGRTHQIRVHLSAIGHPVVGDFLYGCEDSAIPQRFALHSSRIRLTHPMTRETIELTSPLPRELELLMDL